ncbi:hypothetical protein [Caballeronia sp. LZ016]|uniref:hypothetical protein n=1 Tax=Caballeronia sp. LZ016 TaxID=3038554 RepID=UPI00285EFA1A|nr:hypothetical protein [Caballeronia sp. LZ016]MDR5739152.1 hypothetical protein [Caballeronia sp. LZ016]
MVVLWASALLGAMALAAMIVTQLNGMLNDASERVALPASAANSPAPDKEHPPSSPAGATVTADPEQSQYEATTAESKLDPQQQFAAEVMQQEPEFNRIINDPDWRTFLQMRKGELTIAELLTAAYNRQDMQAVVNFFEAFKLSKYAAATRGVSFAEELRYEDEVMRQLPDANARTYRTSFDCASFRSTPEYLICRDIELANADLILAHLVREAQAAVVDKAALAERLRKQWNHRQQKCADKPCLAAWYAYEQDVLIKIAQTGDVNAK